MSFFEEYRQLDLLHLLANVCRHGDGPSSRRLWHRCPEFWPDRIHHPRPSWTTVPTAEAAPSTANTHLPGDRLHTFVSPLPRFGTRSSTSISKASNASMNPLKENSPSCAGNARRRETDQWPAQAPGHEVSRHARNPVTIETPHLSNCLPSITPRMGWARPPPRRYGPVPASTLRPPAP